MMFQMVHGCDCFADVPDFFWGGMVLSEVKCSGMHRESGEDVNIYILIIYLYKCIYI